MTLVFSPPKFVSTDQVNLVKRAFLATPSFAPVLMECLKTSEDLLNRQLFCIQKVCARDLTMKSTKKIETLAKRIARNEYSLEELKRVLTVNVAISPYRFYTVLCKNKRGEMDPNIKDWLVDLDISSPFWPQQAQTKSAAQEEKLGTYFQSLGISFKHENQIRFEQSSKYGQPISTPDFVFDPPIKVSIDFVETEIKWIDYKDNLGVPEGIIFEKTKEQVAKYYKAWGYGAIIYGLGLVENYPSLEGAIVIDGSSFCV